MGILDWIVLGSSLTFIVLYGYWKSKNIQSSHAYFKGSDDTQWWTIGLGVMATQASAITFMSTPGQAFYDGLGFVQIYFGLPLAMVIISVTFIPLYHKLKVYTAYEFLEKRFDLKTRSLTAVLFLVQRGLAAGITIYAPAIILSTLLGWDLNTLNILIGGLVILYTVSGGTQAVNVTQKQQMFVIMAGMFFVFYYILTHIHPDVDFSKAMQIASLAGKTEVVNFSFDPSNRYTIWSGLLGGLFLSLSYFGTDQSQVQRYLSGSSMTNSRLGLVFNGIFKIPMQFFILLTGVLVFVFYQFHPAPVFYNNTTVTKIESTTSKSEWANLTKSFDSIQTEKKQLLVNQHISNPDQLKKLWNQEKELKLKSQALIKSALPEEEINDKDYVFIHFILENLPSGLIGLLLAVIFAAAMSSTSAELNALATITAVDIYKRNINQNVDDKQLLLLSRMFTVGWGLLAILFASFGNLYENLIQLVNIVGSIFYGVILGIFIIAFYFKRLLANEVFYGALIAQAAVLCIFFTLDIGYLWLNAIGCVAVVLFSMFLRIMNFGKVKIS
jgi:solute:Na+ symporter, SSS family